MRRAAAASLIAAACLTLACGKKRTPIPTPPPREPAGDARTPSDLPPHPVELDLQVAPERIPEGESAILTWEARYASSVRIDPQIGSVDSSGEITVYPTRTTTYRATANGPGGQTERSVTIEVAPPGEGVAPDIPEVLEDAPLAERFAAFVRPVFFDFDSAQLNESARVTLDGNAAWLSLPENLEVRFIIQGHCDQRGTEEYNLALGDMRAQVVQAYLASKGIDPARSLTVTYGEERPFSTEETEEGYQLNRRAHFVLSTSDAPGGGR